MESPEPTNAGLLRRLIDWLCADREDYRQFRLRKATRPHLARRNVCLWVWAGAAGLMMICPGPACMIVMLLGATFLSFAVLDGE